jgi:hypothetical protein
LVKLCPVLAWDPHGSGDGTRQRGRKRVLSGTDVPRMYPRRLFAELASRAKSQVSGGEGMYVGRVGLEPTTGGL